MWLTDQQSKAPPPPLTTTAPLQPPLTLSPPLFPPVLARARNRNWSRPSLLRHLLHFPWDNTLFRCCPPSSRERTLHSRHSAIDWTPENILFLRKKAENKGNNLLFHWNGVGLLQVGCDWDGC